MPLDTLEPFIPLEPIATTEHLDRSNLLNRSRTSVTKSPNVVVLIHICETSYRPRQNYLDKGGTHLLKSLAFILQGRM